MRTHLRRVHILKRSALVFIGATLFVASVGAQTQCAELRTGEDAQGRWQLLTPHVGGDVLRYTSSDQSCEFPLQGQAVSAPLVSHDADQAVVATRDGRVIGLPMRGRPWPLPSLRLQGHITAIALSGPGQTGVIAVATHGPDHLHMLSASLQSLQRLRLMDKTGRHTSPICALLVSPQRQSFVALFSDLTELWEVSYNPRAPEIGLGMVHDFQYREGHFVPGYLHPLRTALPWKVAVAGLDGDGHLVQLHGHPALPPAQAALSMVIHLDVRKPVTETARISGPLYTCGRVDLL